MSAEAIAVEYLAELEREAQVLPPDRRVDLMGDIGDHLAAARAAGANDEAAVRAVLQRLGSPRDIVAAERDASVPQQVVVVQAVPGTGRELASLLLLSVGSIVVPILGWLIGVALLWTSPWWRPGEKLLGTLVWPGGWLAVLVALTMPTSTCTSGTLRRVNPDDHIVTGSCTGHTPPAWLAIPSLIVLVGAPIVVAVFLLLRAQRRAADASARQAQLTGERRANF